MKSIGSLVLLKSSWFCVGDYHSNTGSGHCLVSLEDLVEELTKETTGLREKAQQKYEELSSMLKQITMHVAGFDTETEETIAEIRKARDEQVCLDGKLLMHHPLLETIILSTLIKIWWRWQYLGH